MGEGTLWTAILGVIGSIVVGYLGYMGVKSGVKAEARKKESDQWQAREDRLWKNVEKQIAELQTKVERQDKQIQSLIDRLDAKDSQLGEQARKVRELQDRERDRSELIADFLEAHVATEEWFEAGGYDPPMPDQSWRVKQAVAQYKASRQTGVA